MTHPKHTFLQTAHRNGISAFTRTAADDGDFFFRGDERNTHRRRIQLNPQTLNDKREPFATHSGKTPPSWTCAHGTGPQLSSTDRGEDRLRTSCFWHPQHWVERYPMHKRDGLHFIWWANACHCTSQLITIYNDINYIASMQQKAKGNQKTQEKWRKSTMAPGSSNNAFMYTWPLRTPCAPSFKHLLCQLRHRQGTVLLRATRGQWCEAGHEEV